MRLVHSLHNSVFDNMFHVADAFPDEKSALYAGHVLLTLSNMLAIVVGLVDRNGRIARVGNKNSD